MDGVNLNRFRALVDEYPSRQMVAEMVGCDTSTITRHYSGERKMSAEFLRAYCKAFGVSSDYLLDLIDSKSRFFNLQNACQFTRLEDREIMILAGLPEKDRNIIKKIIRIYGKGEE